MTNVIVRVPPSPTGRLHVGTARTMLFNYLFAKQHGGKILFRSEDTDKERSKREYEEDIINGLAWLGLSFDNTDTIYRQSEHGKTYEKYLKKLIDSGDAYVSKEEPTEAGERTEIIRFKNPGKVVTFSDIIRGEVSFDTTELGDFVIAKSMTEPLYHLAVVVDDIEMGVTHIIRGEDHISNTQRQILIQEAFGKPRPVYAHIPLILMPDRSKMSKRKHGEAVSIGYYKDGGYLPEAIINFLALLGWNPGTEQELFSLDELVRVFDFSKVQKSGAIFNVEKLNWFNKEYIKRLDQGKLLDMINAHIPETVKQLPEYSREKLEKSVSIIVERIDKFDDVRTMGEAGELDYLFSAPAPSKELLTQKFEFEQGATAENLKNTISILSNISAEQFSKVSVKESVWDFATSAGRANVLWPMRTALTGLSKSPDPFTVAELIGKDETIKRLENALKVL